MNSCEFKDITGLSSYVGFKSLLANSAATKRFRNEDDTIIFNRIQYVDKFNPLSLKNNQVAIILNCTLNDDPTALPYPESIRSVNLNGNALITVPNALLFGMVVYQYINVNNYASNQDAGVVVAIFDLY